MNEGVIPWTLFGVMSQPWCSTLKGFPPNSEQEDMLLGLSLPVSLSVGVTVPLCHFRDLRRVTTGGLSSSLFCEISTSLFISAHIHE